MRPPSTEILAVPAARSRFIAAVLAHTLVDFFAFFIIPLLTVLKGTLLISDREAALLITIGGVTSGVIQPVVAWLSDKLNTRVLATLGTLVGVVAVGLTGYAPDYKTLVLLQVLAAGGIGTFHPIAAASVGQLSGPHRSFGLSIFYFTGMVGGIAGNVCSPLYVKYFGGGIAADGLHEIAWLIIPGVVYVGVLAWAIHGVPHRHADAHREHAALPAAVRRRRWTAVGQLYACNVLRFGVDSAVIAILVRWTEVVARGRFDTAVLTEAGRTYAAGINGPLQAAKQIGMGVGGLLLGWMIRRGGAGERRAMIVVPFLAVPAIGLLPYSSPGVGFVLMVLAGVGYGSLIAPTIALAQRLLPHRTGLASGLMMGGAWAVGAGMAPVADGLVDSIGLRWTCGVFAVLCVASSLLAAALPKGLLDRPGSGG